MLKRPRCIYQDNRKDWEIEASRMKDVYRNAAFCIAATAAKDGNHGLFYERDPRSVHPVKINMSWSMALHLLASKHTNGGQGFMELYGSLLMKAQHPDTDNALNSLSDL
jgi:hypothetical protein